MVLPRAKNMARSITELTDTIFFDLDDTILDFHAAERAALTDTLGQLGVAPTEEILERYSELNLQQWKLLERGEITRDALKVRRYALLFAEFGLACPPEEAARLYEDRLCLGHYFMAGAEELLAALAGRYGLYIVTNGTARVQKSRIRSAGLEAYFRDVFISEAIGYDKPDARFFQSCFARIPGFVRENALLVGDSLSSDIAGGKNAGLRTVWYNRRGEENRSGIVPDHEIMSLGQLPSLLAAEA